MQERCFYRKRIHHPKMKIISLSHNLVNKLFNLEKLRKEIYIQKSCRSWAWKDSSKAIPQNSDFSTNILLQLYPFFHSTTIQASCDYIRLSHSIDFNTYGIQNACKFFNFAMPQPTVQNAQNPFYKFNLQHSQTVIITINWFT